jgi:D-glycero-D-manno-heptose 1,7-bisphosphate phosphatase
MTAHKQARALILDRDGTLVIDRHYLDDPAQLCFLPGALAGLRVLTERGHPIVVVTNQSGVGRGLFTLERMQEINDRLIAMAAAGGARIDAVYSCPHDPAVDCECRKPKARLVLEAAQRFGFDPASSIVIGDKSTDVELGRRLGATTMLISTDGRAADDGWVEPDYIVRDLLEAARIIDAPGRLRDPLPGAPPQASRRGS